MQSLQTQHDNHYDYIDCNYQSVDDFLHHCHLGQYLDVFLNEGFDSVTALLEITEEDMIFMNVKRGHRRLIQREIANVKGIPYDQPLATNVLGTKYFQETPPNVPIKIDELRRINNSNSTSNSTSNIYNNSTRNTLLTSGLPVHDNIATGLASPRSMNSGIGGNTSASSGNYSSPGPINMRSRMPQPQQFTAQTHSSIDSGNSSMLNSSNSNNYISKPNNLSNSNNDNGNSSNDQNEIIEALSNSISSNDDADSMDTNESVLIKRKYRRHAKPDRNAPLKPPSAYIMFSNDSRAELKNQNLSFAELAKIVGDQWKNLSHIEKQSYERRAMQAKDEYLAALEQYRQTSQYRRYQEYFNEFKSKHVSSNRVIGRGRKRTKQASPGSGSIADSSSNGNSNGSGSSGSGSADTYGDKESVMRRQRQASDDKLAQSQQALPTQTDTISSPSVPNSQQQKSTSKHNENTCTNATNNSDTLKPTYNFHHEGPQQPQQSSDSGYNSQSYYNNNVEKTQSPQWDYRSNQTMRGMLPVEFVLQNPATTATTNATTSTDSNRQKPPSFYSPKKITNDVDMEDDQEDENSLYEDNADQDGYKGEKSKNSYENKRRSPRFNMSNPSNKTSPTMQEA